MADEASALRHQRLKYNYIVGQMDIVLNVELGPSPFITLQTFKDKYAELFYGQDVQTELKSLGCDFFEVVEKHFQTFKAMRDPNLPGLLRRSAIYRPTQSTQFTFAGGEDRVQGSPIHPAIEAPVEVMPEDSAAEAGGRVEAVPGRVSEYFAEQTPPCAEPTILTEEREEKWGIDAMDRIPTADDAGMLSARKVLPIVKPSPNNQSQSATRRSPGSDRQENGGETSRNRSNAVTRSPSARHETSESSSVKPQEERFPVGGRTINVHDYFDEGIGVPIRAQQTEDDVPDGVVQQAEADRVAQGAPPVPAPEPQVQQQIVKKTTEEKMKAMYAGRHYPTAVRRTDDADFACDNLNQSRQQPAQRFGSVFGAAPQPRADSATAPSTAGPKPPSFKMSSHHTAQPSEQSGRGEAATAPQGVKVDASLAGERSESGADHPTANYTATPEAAVLSNRSSTDSAVEDEYSSSDFHTAQSAPLDGTDSSQDVFATASEDSEEEETRTLRPSGSSLSADMPATPKASRSMTAFDQSVGGLAIDLEQFGLHDLLPELNSAAHTGLQSAASAGSTAVNGAQPASSGRNMADDFFDSLECFTSAPSATVCRNDAVDLECFATDFLEEPPSDTLPTEERHAQPSPTPSASPAAPPKHQLYVMRDEWHIDNYEAASAERRRLCEESADFREPPSAPVRVWIDHVKDVWVLLDLLLDLNATYPEGFTPDDLAKYEYDLACAERHGMYHWAATIKVIGLHRMLEIRMITVDAVNRKFRVNKAIEDVALMWLPYNFCSNLYRCLEDNGEMEVRQATRLLKSFEPPPARLSDRDLLHLINHFPRVFLLECKDKEHDFFKATVKLNPDLPRWRVVLDMGYPDYTLFMPIPDCPHAHCSGPW